MTEAQVWTVIGVLSATLVSFMAATITMILRTITAQLGGLRNEMRAEIGGLRNEMNARMTSLDRDVQALTNRVFGSDSGR